MQQSLLEQVKQGRHYVNLWPQRPELIQYFSEYRAVIVSRFVLKYGGALALLAFLMPILFIGIEQLKQSLVYSLFIGSLPVQALFLMNNKSKEKLPPSLANWYRSGVEKLKAKNDEGELIINKPTFLDLAKLLNISYSQK
ncbi:terminus macrodomain insulation protein YfbV [Thalassotalea psychrophila]|uniref:UPF0208 membrane protein YfbV n=1 Tax=Thalassotalea psychrophila TaxID=3065647 RepID=A0ABY9U1Y1_9GAMM|nr:terminus macrodomain insulation protein YfbV [Colwelliaceae bacterium SQ149]